MTREDEAYALVFRFFLAVVVISSVSSGRRAESKSFCRVERGAGHGLRDPEPACYHLYKMVGIRPITGRKRSSCDWYLLRPVLSVPKKNSTMHAECGEVPRSLTLRLSFSVALVRINVTTLAGRRSHVISYNNIG